jgi:hypothetical protein
VQFSRRDGPGIPLVVYSALLTRGIESAAAGVTADMDTGLGNTNTLIGAHNYATQELVNLLLTGRAHSNVFDGEQRLDDGSADGGADVLVLRGVPRRADVGLLSLFESYDHVKVGSFYKSPRAPVWVVCSESHYSVLFAAPAGAVFPPAAAPGGAAQRRNFGHSSRGTVHALSPARCLGLRLVAEPAGSRGGASAAEPFDLLYFDGLAAQDEVVRLTVTPKPASHSADDDDEAAGEDEDEDAPPLERVIHTRWRGAKIDWNGAEVIL